MKVYVCFPEGKAKALTMSYDDGKIQDERLVSIFNRYGIWGTFNLNYGMIDKEGLIPPRIKSSRINELYAGHEIATREFDTLKSKKVPQSLEIGLFFCQIFIFII